MNEEQINEHLKKEALKNPNANTIEIITTLLPAPLAYELCKLAGVKEGITLKKLSGKIKEKLIQILVCTPLTVNGHDGFRLAMITRGGVSLKEIDPKTMQSRLIKGLFFCGEIINLDGPCGGYNLQWSFTSGYLAGVNG